MAWLPIVGKPDWEYSTDPNLDKKPIDHYDYDNDAVHNQGKKKMFAGEKYVLARQIFHQHPGYGEIYVKDPGIEAWFADLLKGRTAIAYDPQDLTTLYQDATGTLPVYRPGTGLVDPPVGLMLDKGQGLELGPELVFNGDFSDGTTGWTRANGKPFSVTGDGELEIPGDSDALWDQVNSTPFTVSTSKKYICSCIVRSDNAAISSLVLIQGGGNSYTALVYGTTKTRHTFIFSPLSTSVYFSVAVGQSTSTATVWFSDVSVREIKGYHAYQTTTTARPTLSGRYNLMTNTDAPHLSVGEFAQTQDGSTIGGHLITRIERILSQATQQIVGAVQGNSVIFRIKAKQGTNELAAFNFLVRNVTTSTNLLSINFSQQSIANSNGVASISDISDGWREIKIEITSGITAGNIVSVFFGSTGTGVIGEYWYIAAPDLRVANDGVGLPPYQRVVNANTYDTAGFPLYLRFDGVDDFLQTANVDLTGTNSITLGAGIRKYRATGTNSFVIEAGSTGNIDGNFYLLAPGAGSYTYSCRVTSLTDGYLDVDVTGTSYPAPITNSIIAAFDTSDKSQLLLIDNTVIENSIGISSLGSFKNLPLFIGARAGYAFPFEGRIYSLCILGSLLSTAEQDIIERYLNAKTRAY